MRALLILLMLIVSSTIANADYYIINTETNRAVGRTQYYPDAADLATRGEVAVRSDMDIPINDAELFQGNIQKRVKSQSEINEELAKQEEIEEMAEIYHLMFRDAYKSAVKDGKTFKHMDKHVDNINSVKAEALQEKQIMDELKNK